MPVMVVTMGFLFLNVFLRPRISALKTAYRSHANTISN
jgi:hypothetical protein